MRRTFVLAGILAVAGAAQADILHDYENLTEGFLGTSYSADGITYRDVNQVSGSFPDGSTFTPGDLGDQVVIENAGLFYNDFPTYGSPVNAMTFGSVFVPGENLSIGALASVYIDIAGGANAASFDLAYYENGPWGGIEYHLDAMNAGQVVASDFFAISDLGGRDNATFTTMSVSGATFDTLHLYATWNGGYSAPRGMIDNLDVSPVPEPATITVLGFAALAALRRRKR